MADFNITADDRDLILRAVATEVDHRLATSNPAEYQRQIAGVVDTIVNRAASGQFGDSIEAVLNAPNQFSAINGPRGRGYTVHGSVRAVPDSRIPNGLSDVVNGWLNERIDGAPSSVGGGLHYANPNFSDANNKAWINKLEGPRFGVGESVHYHGTTAGYKPFEATLTGDFYNGQGIKLPPGEIPNVVGSLLDVNRPRTYGTIDPDAVAGTPAIRQGLLDTLKDGPVYRQFLPPLADAPNMDSVGPGATRAELAAFRGPTRSLMDEIGAGATRAELAQLSGADQPRPVSHTKRPRPESYAGQERGTPIVLREEPARVRTAAELASLYQDGGPTRVPTDQIGIAPTGRPMLQNADGSVSTELSITVTDPRINDGRPTNVPTIWGGQRLNDDMAVNAAVASGQQFTAFPSIAAAEAAAQYRSANEILPDNQPGRARSLMEMLALNDAPFSEADGPTTRTQADRRRSTVPMSTDAISYAGQERGEGSLLRSLQQPPATDRSANFTRAADLDNSTINAFTPVTTRDGQTVISVADMLYGDEFTTELPGGTRRNIPSGGLVGAMSEPMPTETATRSGSTRPAGLLAALTGNGMAWDAAQDGPTRRAGTVQRQQTTSVPTNGSYAGQERGEMVRTPNQGNMTPTNSPGIFRVAGLNGTAGNVGLPSGVRPDVDIPDFEADWSKPAPTVQRRDEIEDGATWDEFTGIFGTRQRQEPERKPNPFAYVPPPTTFTKPTQLSQEPSGQTPRFRTVTREERYENPAYTAWKVESNRNATRADVPLGEMMYGARSRDSVAQAAAGQNFVNTQMPQQWLTRTVSTQVPVKPTTPVVKPVVGAPVTPRRAQATAQNIWQNPIQGLLGALAPAGGPVQGLLGALSTRRPPSDNFLMSIGAIDDGISENNRTPSIGGN